MAVTSMSVGQNNPVSVANYSQSVQDDIHSSFTRDGNTTYFQKGVYEHTFIEAHLSNIACSSAPDVKVQYADGKPCGVEVRTDGKKPINFDFDHPYMVKLIDDYSGLVGGQQFELAKCITVTPTQAKDGTWSIDFLMRSPPEPTYAEPTYAESTHDIFNPIYETTRDLEDKKSSILSPEKFTVGDLHPPQELPSSTSTTVVIHRFYPSPVLDEEQKDPKLVVEPITVDMGTDTDMPPDAPGTKDKETLPPSAPGTKDKETLPPSAPGTKDQETLPPSAPGTKDQETLTPDAPGTKDKETLPPSAPGTKDQETLPPSAPGTKDQETLPPSAPGTKDQETLPPSAPGTKDQETLTPDAPGTKDQETLPPSAPGTKDQETLTPDAPGTKDQETLPPSAPGTKDQETLPPTTTDTTTGPGLVHPKLADSSLVYEINSISQISSSGKLILDALPMKADGDDKNSLNAAAGIVMRELGDLSKSIVEHQKGPNKLKNEGHDKETSPAGADADSGLSLNKIVIPASKTGLVTKTVVPSSETSPKKLLRGNQNKNFPPNNSNRKNGIGNQGPAGPADGAPDWIALANKFKESNKNKDWTDGPGTNDFPVNRFTSKINSVPGTTGKEGDKLDDDDTNKVPSPASSRGNSRRSSLVSEQEPGVTEDQPESRPVSEKIVKEKVADMASSVSGLKRQAESLIEGRSKVNPTDNPTQAKKSDRNKVDLKNRLDGDHLSDLQLHLQKPLRKVGDQEKYVSPPKLDDDFKERIALFNKFKNIEKTLALSDKEKLRAAMIQKIADKTSNSTVRTFIHVQTKTGAMWSYGGGTPTEHRAPSSRSVLERPRRGPAPPTPPRPEMRVASNGDRIFSSINLQ